MTFELAWQYADAIKGWYTKAEGKLLWDCVQGAKVSCEVGSYRGRSTSLLAQSDSLVHAIEPFLLAPGSPNDRPTSGGRYVSDEVHPEIFSDFFRYLAPFCGNVILHAKKTEECSKDIKAIGLLHIDGDHIDGVFRDIELLIPALKPGGFAVFHDYEPIHTKFTRVKEAVDALGWEVVGRADSAIAVRKPL
jgi:hypothetical protein